ncbi:MAG: DNA translocase FtsK 4TM domain-containing protein [Muribaculaceae bacterium]|nr:DNA translocase FtsK 4TM domain-containing protein [Muribaculaceae bacterium]
MKQYHNYSPEISSADESTEPVVVEQPPQKEPERAGRRRNSRQTKKSEASSASKPQSKSVQEKANTEPEKNQSVSIIKSFKEWRDSVVTRSVFGIILGGLGFWFAVAFVSYFSTCVADQSLVASGVTGPEAAVANDAGEGGARLTELIINQGFGVGAIVIVVWLLCMSLKLLIGYPKFRTLDFTIKSLIAFITLSVVVGMVSIGLDTDVNWGGFHGRYINEIIYGYIGWSGAIIISVVLISIFVVICLRDAIKWMLKKKRQYDERRRLQREEEEAELRKQEETKEREREAVLGQALYAENEDPDEPKPEPTQYENVEFDPNADTIFDLPDLEDEDDPYSRFDTIQDDPNSLAVSEDPMEENSLYSDNSNYNEESSYNDNSNNGVESKYSEESTNKEESNYSDISNNSNVSNYSVNSKENAYDDSHKESSEEVSYDHISTAQTELDEEYGHEEETYHYENEQVKEAVTEVENIPSKELTSSEEVDKEDKPTEPEKEDLKPADVMTVNVNQIEKGSSQASPGYDSNFYTHEYKFPPTDYLRPGSDKISVDPDELLENKEKIRQTLLDFGIPITSIEATVGPTVTLYEIRPDTGVKIAKIRNLVDDLALSLAANGVRIIAPIPGKGTVGIEVANKEAQTVSMRTIIQSKAYQNSKYKLPVALGSTISNDVYIADLAKMPHLLVAGATGQGKSVGLNAIVTSLLYSKRPEELKFVMVDPKRVEFSLYSKIEKYYLAKIPDSPQPIITNMENVVATLSSLCVEMDERYMLLEKAFVRQVTEYNDKFRAKKLDPREGHRFMPYIVVIIDEFADLIMTAGKEVELPIARLAQLARAVGIHVIIATQRPSTNVITGMIKANFPVRIAFKVSSGVDSKTILDSTGAQQLIGRGDMLISNNGEMTRVQCAFVDTPEVEEVCDYIARQPYPQGPYLLPEPQIGGDSDSQEVDAASVGKLDPLFAEVGRQVIMSGTASTSAVQRRYEIGYNRAGRIMDQLEAYGVVGPATGGKPRSVLMDAMAFEDLLATLGLS